MVSRRRIAIILSTLSVLSVVFRLTEMASAAVSPAAALRERVLASVGIPAWNPEAGYSLSGRFTLKATGTDLEYRARYARVAGNWAAEYASQTRSRTIRYVRSGKKGWISTPELTADVPPGMLPYMAQFDFPRLYWELLRILDKGDRDSLFATGMVGNELHIRGRLDNGWEVIFVLNTVEYFPRKALISIRGEPSNAWLIGPGRTDGSCALEPMPGESTQFEIWISDPVESGNFRYARRLDFVDRDSVVGTLLMEGAAPLGKPGELFRRPPDSPWLASLAFSPDGDGRPVFQSESERAALRTRVERRPWSEWNRRSNAIALWSPIVLMSGSLGSPSWSTQTIVLMLALSMAALVVLLLRRKRESGRRFSWRLLFCGLVVALVILAGIFAARQAHAPRDRSLLSLHAAIRSSIAGSSFYSRSADALLLDFEQEAPAGTIEELGQSCQAYAMAYDLIRSCLSGERRRRIEMDLFAYAKPLYGALQGWSAHQDESAHAAAGLGLVGLAIRYEPYVKSSAEAMQQTIDEQFTKGLHRSGPGPGILAMDSAVNLFYGLKRSGGTDFYARPAFKAHVDAAMNLLSPAGTLPLFGETNLEQSARLSAFLLKAAGSLPDEQAGQCVWAHDRYWTAGRYGVEGTRKWIWSLWQPLRMHFENPYLLLQYLRDFTPQPAPALSAVLGGGQAAILRSGGGRDAAYLALNAPVASSPSRDALTFDLFAYGSLLLHGPGHPGRSRPEHSRSTETSSANSITLNNESHAPRRSAGVQSFLINQPLFDLVSAFAGSAYDYGSIQRDIVMVRADDANPAYYIMVDHIAVADPTTSVQWHLHGRGEVETGVDGMSRWTSSVYEPPRLRSNRVILEVLHPMGEVGTLSKRSGRLLSERPSLDQSSNAVSIEWAGGRRFCTILFPRRPEDQQPARIAPSGQHSCRIGGADWFSLGRLDARTTVGPLSHVCDYVVVRDRKRLFPAMLMVSGTECSIGEHAIASGKPITASLLGLDGSLKNPRPDTKVEFRSPEIRSGDRFRLDDTVVEADVDGILNFTLASAGEHVFRRATAR